MTQTERKVLTPLEAIEVMKKGKTVREVFDGHFPSTWKLIDGHLYKWYEGETKYVTNAWGKQELQYHESKYPHWQSAWNFPFKEAFYIVEDPEIAVKEKIAAKKEAEKLKREQEERDLYEQLKEKYGE